MIVEDRATPIAAWVNKRFRLRLRRLLAEDVILVRDRRSKAFDHLIDEGN